VKDGQKVSWLLEANDAYDPDMKAEPDFTTHILFEQAEGLEGFDPPVPAEELLTEIVNFTRDNVVQRFARACLGGAILF